MKTTGLFFLAGTVVVAGKIPSPDISVRNQNELFGISSVRLFLLR